MLLQAEWKPAAFNGGGVQPVVALPSLTTTSESRRAKRLVRRVLPDNPDVGAGSLCVRQLPIYAARGIERQRSPYWASTVRDRCGKIDAHFVSF